MLRFELCWVAIAVLTACSGGVVYDPDGEGTTSNVNDADGGVGTDDVDDSDDGTRPSTKTDDATDDAAPTGPGDDADPSEPSEPADDPGPTIVAPAPGETTRLARLTHDQYDNTISDLLGVDTDVTSAFAPDALNGFEFSTSLDYVVDKRLGPQYRAAAEELADQVVASDESFAHVARCSGDAGACRDEFVQDFGLRAFRRPLTSTETTRFSDLFDLGPELVGSGDDYRDGVALVVEAALQSPQFIYRTELGDETDDDGIIPLSPWETASRLSYFIYDSMPDQPLLDAAANDELNTTEQIRAQIERMLDDPRALRKLVSFHEQAWKFDRFAKISPDPEAFPGLPNDIVGRVRSASERYVEDVITGGGGLPELLTEPFAYADSALAPLYGLSTGDTLTRVEFEDGQRLGFLMQVGFLAANAYAVKTDPIHRGLFIVRDLLCRTIPDPPAGASMTPLPEGSPVPETTREEVTLLTSPGECVGCHLQINPPGFAFEGFGAMGQLRTEEDGHEVAVDIAFALDGEERQFDGPIELVRALADSEEAQRCYARKWVQFARGRALTKDESSVIDELDGTASVRQLVIDVATAGAFLERRENEVAQ